MRASSLRVLLLALTLAAATAQGGSWTHDAGTGEDAPGSAANALPVAYGSFAGYAWKGDADWYAPPSAAAISCVEHAVTGLKGTTALQVGTETATGAFNGSTSRLALASQAGGAVRAAVHGPARWSESGEYAVTLQHLDAAALSSRPDAGDSPATATPWSGGCAGGTVSLMDADHYSLAVPQEGHLLVSAASLEAAQFQLRSPSGGVLATLAPGETLSLSGLAGGTYTMSASSMNAGSATYALAAIVQPPCWPNC